MVGREIVQKHYNEESQKALKPSVERLPAKGIAAKAVALVGDPGANMLPATARTSLQWERTGAPRSRTSCSARLRPRCSPTKVPVLLLR
jgi:hypothetical protein